MWKHIGATLIGGRRLFEARRLLEEIRYIHTALSVSHYIRGGRKGRGCFNLCAYYTYMNRHLVKYWNYNALDVIPWLFQSLI